MLTAKMDVVPVGLSVRGIAKQILLGAREADIAKVVESISQMEASVGTFQPGIRVAWT
ncbi:hypothetical protein HpMS107_13410 [Helicobacter pylori]